MIIPQFILPDNVQLKANALSILADAIIINASVCQYGSICPVCHKSSNRIHSKYVRKLSDLPISGSQARIELTARKYFCDNALCTRKIFTERFDCEIMPYNRRLIRSNDLLVRMALELGGNMGSKISNYVKIPVSASTMLRIIKKLHIADKPVTSGIIGVDDWAFKKGNTYGTIIVDLQSKEVIDLLPDREGDTLAEWLKMHQEVKMVSRDRYGPYALGIKKGAPQSFQVADRFHLLMNLGEATKKVFQSKGKELKEAFHLYNHIENKKPDPVIEVFENPEAAMQEQQNIISSGNISIKRLFAFDKVKELKLAGYSVRAIERALKMSRQTIRKYINQEMLTKRQNSLSSNFDDFIGVLLDEKNRSMNYKQLYALINKMGFSGKYSSFCTNMNRIWKKEFPTIPRVVTMANPGVIKSWSPTKLSFMLYLDNDQLKSNDRKFLKILFENCPAIKEMETVVKKFKQLFREKKDGQLKLWIEESSKPKSVLKNFAINIGKDFEAVNNAVITPYSNGQVEGQVNRLKNIKRKMYGRANFELLRKMVLSKTG
jgi:transposase